MMQGTLIVLEGIDGSGKSTQYELLRQRLRTENIDHRAVSFPRYEAESSALVRAYLAGEFGKTPSDVNPYAASTFYAVDRYAAFQTDWGTYYQNGGLVLCSRYTTSNACHQGAKLSPAARTAYLDWLFHFEYTLLGLPKPDLVFYMDLDIDTAWQRLRNRPGGKDIHERDRDYLAACLEAGKAAAVHQGWRRVAGDRRAEAIHEEIFRAIKQHLR